MYLNKKKKEKKAEERKKKTETEGKTRNEMTLEMTKSCVQQCASRGCCCLRLVYMTCSDLFLTNLAVPFFFLLRGGVEKVLLHALDLIDMYFPLFLVQVIGRGSVL